MSESNDNLERVLAFLRGAMNPSEEECFREEATSDPALGQLLADMEDISGQVAHRDWDDLRGPSHALLAGLLDGAKSAANEGPPWTGMITFDSRLLPAPEGVRPAAVDARRIKAAIGPYRLELSCQPVSAHSYELIGQIEGWDCDAPAFVEGRSGKDRQSAVANEFGVFRIERAVAGSYRVQLKDRLEVVGELSFEL